MSDLINWLLEGPAWIQYRTRLDLLDQSEQDTEVLAAKQGILKDNQIKEIIKELKNWPGSALKGHKDLSHLIHKLVFLSDIGLNANDSGISSIINKILAHQSAEGLFQIYINVPKHYGGTGEGMWSWMLCDAPLILYALVQLGLKEDKKINNAVSYLVNLINKNGWRCTVSPKIKFRGPGKKEDPCPYATLIMLKLLVKLDEWIDSEASRIGVETILTLWKQSREIHPYMFYMGTDFRKLKAPLAWYDILHVLDVLVPFPWLKKDKRIIEMIEIVKAKADSVGRFTSESIYTKLKGWEFAQKKEPSRWLTLLAKRTLKRFN